MKVMTKEHRFIVVSLGGAPNQYSIGDQAGNWTQPVVPQGVFHSSTYFDLAGLTLEEKTLFFKGATVQQLGNPTIQSGAAGDACQIYDIMTSSPMTADELTSFISAGNFSGLTPAATSGLTFDQTIYARRREYVVSVDLAAWGAMQLVSDDQLGSMNPTASDRVYSYRMVGVDLSGTSKTLAVLGSRQILSAEAKSEPEFQYLMRLKRSYELQNEPDVD
jgi:hypothetical protein